MIRFIKVSLKYREGVQALDNVNLHIKPGEMVFLIGHSGAGKSSLIKALQKEVNVDTGKIYVDGVDITHLHRRRIPSLRRKVGMVFQDYRLLEKQTVYENVAYAMEITGAKRKYIKENVPIALRLVGLNDKGGYYPSKLSGGEAQRVSIARAMVNKPEILIADEPTGNLDPVNAREIMKILIALNKRGTTIVIVTHDESLVHMCSCRVIEMKGGKIVSDTGSTPGGSGGSGGASGFGGTKITTGRTEGFGGASGSEKGGAGTR